MSLTRAPARLGIDEGATTTHAVLQDDFYSAAIGTSVGANGVEVAATGEPYNGSGGDQNRVRWAHR